MARRTVGRDEAAPLCFSELYGGALYRATEPETFTHVLTGQTLYPRRVDLKEADLDRYRERLFHPMPCVNWPVDLVCLPEPERVSRAVDQVYVPAPPERPTGRYAVLFCAPPQTGGTVLSRMRPRNWTNPAVQRLAVRLTEAVRELNQAGNLFFDFHLSRLLDGEDGGPLLDYTHLAVPKTEAARLDPARSGSFPVEFLDPAMVHGRPPDIQAQNYSLCALLFYLFFGRYACDGRLLSGFPDDGDGYSHYAKFQAYYAMPIFIFDPEDRQNALGAFGEDAEIITLWETCPEELRRLFVRTLCGQRERPGPEDWLAALRRVGWGAG